MAFLISTHLIYSCLMGDKKLRLWLRRIGGLTAASVAAVYLTGLFIVLLHERWMADRGIMLRAFLWDLSGLLLVPPLMVLSAFLAVVTDRAGWTTFTASSITGAAFGGLFGFLHLFSDEPNGVIVLMLEGVGAISGAIYWSIARRGVERPPVT